VEREQRVASGRKRTADEELRGERVGQRARERGRDELAQLFRRDVLAGGIDRSEVRRRLAVADVEAADVEPVAPLPPAQPHGSARLQPPFEPRLVEPRGGDGRASVGDPRCQHLQTAAPPLRHGQNLTADRDLLFSAELRDPQLLDRLLVAERPVREQVADRREAESLQFLLDGRTDARERLDRPVQRVSTRKQPRPWPRTRFPARERNRHSASSNQKKPTVPGPACVPTTAPSVVTISISACGRS
jgi:hypothetical protein